MNEVQFATLPTRKIFFRCALPGLLAMVVSSIYMMIDGISWDDTSQPRTGGGKLSLSRHYDSLCRRGYGGGRLLCQNRPFIGPRKNKEANGLFSAAFCMILGIGVLFSLVGFFAAPKLITLLIKDTTLANVAWTTRGYSFISCLPSCLCSPLTTTCASAAKLISVCG